MIGVRLEMEGTLITGSRTLLHNLLRCVEKAGLEIVDICLQPLAAATVAISSDEKNRGVALVDMGEDLQLYLFLKMESYKRQAYYH